MSSWYRQLDTSFQPCVLPLTYASKKSLNVCISNKNSITNFKWQCLHFVYPYLLLWNIKLEPEYYILRLLYLNILQLLERDKRLIWIKSAEYVWSIKDHIQYKSENIKRSSFWILSILYTHGTSSITMHSEKHACLAFSDFRRRRDNNQWKENWNFKQRDVNKNIT